MIACFGTITKDIVECNGKKLIRLGGAPYFFSNVCKDIGIEHSIISKIGINDVCNVKDDNNSIGLQIENETTTLHIRESDIDIISEIINYTGEIDMKKVPNELMSPDIVLISPLFGEIDPDIFNKSLVALDIQGYMRDRNALKLSEKTKKRPDNLEHLLRNVDILKLNEKEAEIIFPGIANTEQLNKLSNMGPDIVIITMGKKGVIVKDHKNIFSFSSKEINSLHTIGAGDTFFSAFLAFYSKTNDAKLSIIKAIECTERFLEGII